jgi:ATP-dependent RNA helicase RhlE
MDEFGHFATEPQNLLFSATFSDNIRQLAKGLIHHPVEIAVSPPNSTVELVEQQLIAVDKNLKAKLLTHLIQDKLWHQVLVFTRTKHGANRLTRHLDKHAIHAAAIHGNKSQTARTKALAAFKRGALQVLVATDIAARGLDIDQLPQVVNFDLPHVPEDYVHRIGRTGRAGATGQALSLVCVEEHKQLVAIERLIQKPITRQRIPGFESTYPLPTVRLHGQDARTKTTRSQPANKRSSRHRYRSKRHDSTRAAR